MAKHREPDPSPPSEPPSSVVRMATVRNSRGRREVESSRLDQSDSDAFVDDLTLITADDQFLDGIAAGRGDVFTMPQKFSSGFPAGSLAPLLATWRSELINPQWPSLPNLEQVQRVAEAVRQPVAKRSARSLKPILGVAVAISALLFGSAAVGAQSARPGDALWPLTQVLYSGHANSVMAGVAANLSLATARSALDDGDANGALQALNLASGDLKKVDDTDGKAGLLAAYQTLLDQATSAATTTSQGSRDAAVEAGGVPVKSQSSGTPAGSTGKTTTTPATSSPPTTTSGSPSGTATAPTRTTAPTGSTVPLPPLTVSTGPVGTTTVTVTAAPSDPSSPATSDAGSTDPSTSTQPSATDPSSTSAPDTTDANTATSTDSATTDPSTTSEIPTPTATPTDSSTDSAGGP